LIAELASVTIVCTITVKLQWGRDQLIAEFWHQIESIDPLRSFNGAAIN